MRIYVAGPMSGQPNLNFPAFMEAGEQIEAMGHEPVVPIDDDEHVDGRPTVESFIATADPEQRAELLKRDLKLLVECDAIAVLDGWRESNGASMEVRVARELEMPVLDAETLEPVAETCLQKANRIVDGVRQQDYGHPLDDFSKTAGMLNGLFRDKLAGGARFEPEDIPLFMQCVKMSRERNKPNPDNWTDGAGYWRTLEKVYQERERREDNKQRRVEALDRAMEQVDNPDDRVAIGFMRKRLVLGEVV